MSGFLDDEIKVRRLGFGAMRLARGSFGGPVRDPEAGKAVLRRAVELGVNHIDTAWFYRAGGVAANDLIREALSPYPEDLVIATKVGPLAGADGSPSEEASAGELRRLVEENLQTLGLDRLDLVYPRVGGMGGPGGKPVGERFEALATLREEGVIRRLGISNVDAAQLAEARAIAPVAAVQNQFHVHQRQDWALLTTCEEAGIAFVPFFPLGGGRSRLDSRRLEPVAGRHGATVTQVALAWLLAVSPVTLAIPGTGSLEHLEENMAAERLQLGEKDMEFVG